MSTKKLSRTVIEGGRANFNKFARYHSHTTERAQARAFCHHQAAADDPDQLPDVQPRRRKVIKDFDDKLGPLRRWLRSQVGKPWNDVYALVRQTFDTRTTAGRHIVFDHLLKTVDHAHDVAGGFYGFHVDAQGVLRRSPPSAWELRRAQRRAEKPVDVYAWAKDRKVMDYGVSQFWMVPLAMDWKECARWKWSTLGHWYNTGRVGVCPRGPHRVSTRRVRVWRPQVGYKCVQVMTDEGVVTYLDLPIKECRQAEGPYRQGPRFTQDDLTLWARLDGYERDLVLWQKGS